MEIRSLKYFLEVAQDENMTEAANVLHVTQPTLSRQIADLEDELDTKLFVRTNRSTLLTEEGMRLKQRAMEILSLVDQTEEEFARKNEDVSGCVRIGAAETKIMHLVTETFAALHERYPKLTCEISSGNVDVIQEQLERGLVDFALLLEPARVEAYNCLRMPETEAVGVVVPADSPWAGLQSVGPADLVRMPLLLSSRKNRATFDAEVWSDEAVTTEDLNVVGRFDLIGNGAALVRTGCACAVSIRGLYQIDDPSLAFVPFAPEVTVGAVFVWKKYRILSRAAEAFLAAFREKLRGSGGSDA